MDSSKTSKMMVPGDNSIVITEDELRCIVCSQFFKDPVLTRCGHRFCSQCLHTWLTEREKKCPIDNKSLDLQKDVFPDNYIKRQISEVWCVCSNNGCDAKIHLAQYDDHLASCPYRTEKYGYSNLDLSLEKCPYESVGCQFKGTKESVLEHQKMSTCTHLQLLLKVCNQLSENTLKCQNSHSDSCSENEKQMQAVNGRLPFYLNDVYEKLTELDQRNKEHTIKINNMTKQLERCMLEINRMKLSSPPEMSNGLLVWKLHSFNEVINHMSRNPAFCYYSPSFSTSEVGYRFRLRLTMSQKSKDALAILVHVIKGSYDYALTWPFVGEISVSIIHPSDSNQRLKSVIKTNCESAAFQRPVLDINPLGFGFPETTRISDLNKLGYIQDNQLIISVSVHSYNTH